MTNTRRLFVAILLPDDIRDAVARVQRQAREIIGDAGIRWTAAEQFHFTLKFLGDVEDSRLEAVTEGVELSAARSARFMLEVAQIGVFPQQRNPQVLWIGATGDIPVLQRTAQYLNEELAKQGFAAETKHYVPHITLARIKTREGEEMTAKNLPLLQFEPEFRNAVGTFPIQDYALMQSELRPDGAVHTLIKSFAFGARNEYNR